MQILYIIIWVLLWGTWVFWFLKFLESKAWIKAQEKSQAILKEANEKKRRNY